MRVYVAIVLVYFLASVAANANIDKVEKVTIKQILAAR